MEGNKLAPKHLMSEEFIIGDIHNLHNYVLEISLSEPDFGKELLDKKAFSKIKKVCQAYSEKWNIPFK
jgi:hypothetical protein